MDRVLPTPLPAPIEAFDLSNKSPLIEGNRRRNGDELFILQPLKLKCPSGNETIISTTEETVIGIEDDVKSHLDTILLKPIEPDYFPEFHELKGVSKVTMSDCSNHAVISNGLGMDLFKCVLGNNSYWEGCHAESIQKLSQIHYSCNSELVMQLKWTTPPCHSCFDEELTIVDILDGSKREVAKIIERKSWVGSRIDREIAIESVGSNGNIDSYYAHFNWNDISINFKAYRSGIVVGTLTSENWKGAASKKKKETSSDASGSRHVLQFLREIPARDKAILIAFMVSLDILTSGEDETRKVIERITLGLLIFLMIAILTYFFLPSSKAAHHTHH